MTAPLIIMAVFFRGLDASLGKLIGIATIAYFALALIEMSMFGAMIGGMIGIAAGFVLFFGSSGANGAGEAFLLKLLYGGLLFIAMMFVLTPPF